jgi:hypothetical protein
MKIRSNIYTKEDFFLDLQQVYEFIKFDTEFRNKIDSIRKEKDFKKRRELKKELPVIIADEGFYFIDIDGLDHLQGNNLEHIELTDICFAIPTIMAFKSVGGEGYKLLVKSNSNPLKYIQKILFKQNINVTIDRARTDMCFLSYDDEIIFENKELTVPTEFIEVEHVILEKKLLPVIDSMKLFDIKSVEELINKMESNYEYHTWLALVGSILSTFGEEALPFLEKKWNDFDFKTLIKSTKDWNSNILDSIWEGRIRKNYKTNKKRKVYTGPTGCGKSKNLIDRILLDSKNNYYIYVTPSVKQAIEFAKKLKREGVTYEILVSEQTLTKYKNDVYTLSMIKKESSNNTKVKIVQLASCKNGSLIKYINKDPRELALITIDELKVTDFMRPSIRNSILIEVESGKIVSSDMELAYESNYNRDDLIYAKTLAYRNDCSGFISSMFNYDCDMEVLSTEELTVKALNKIGFEVVRLGNERLHELKDSTINFHISKDCVRVLLNTKQYKNFITSNNFVEVISNADLNSTYNHENSKGVHLATKNLVVLRQFDKKQIKPLQEIWKSVFKDNEDPTAQHYYDYLMQSVGRSIGFRGQKEVDVLINQTVYETIHHYVVNGYYSFNENQFVIEEETLIEMNAKRAEYKNSVYTYKKTEKDNRDKDRKIEVQNRLKKGNTRLYASEIRQKLGFANLKFIADILGIEPKTIAGLTFIEADWK